MLTPARVRFATADLASCSRTVRLPWREKYTVLGPVRVAKFNRGGGQMLPPHGFTTHPTARVLDHQTRYSQDQAPSNHFRPATLDSSYCDDPLLDGIVIRHIERSSKFLLETLSQI